MALIPYLFVAAYGFQITRRGETYETRSEERNRDLIFAGIAALYTAFMIYAGGMKYVLLSAVLYAPGTLLYLWARREQHRRVFSTPEWVILLLAAIGAVVGIHGLVTGNITI
jgi:arginine:ornithine antiporter/lysine permease